jgi:predicted transcriptional regulator
MDDINDAAIGHIAEKVIAEHGIKKKFVSEQTGIPYSSLISKLKGRRALTVIDILLIAKVVNASPQEFVPAVVN